MEFDWIDTPFNLKALPPKEIEESFEDPFSLRILPDMLHATEARYFNLGKTMAGRSLFTVFWTDGKAYRAILSRDMTPEEIHFYERKNSELA
jgi:uncharacterized DUF497 family protein